MEIEKKRETSWKILLNEKSNKIELTSVEFSGEVRRIRIALKKGDNQIEIEMNREKFFNFLSLISAFKDVVIGDNSNNIDLNYDREKIEDIGLSNEKSENINPINDKNRGLDPKDWDPW
ncbi:MAG: hypothetical protein GF311_11290 [Candidatus Lokiarchaeota archaeon]|nr:hypothetical protein [Candidatus Lokiarchaeota archaeon]